MFVSFDSLPKDARIWLYQANKLLTETQQAEIMQFLSIFLENWTAHQHTLKASAKILNNFCIVIALDEGHQTASGCAIDKQVHCIKQIEEKWGLSLLEHSQIAFLSGGDIAFVHFKDIKTAIADCIITPQTLVFNRNIATLNDLQTAWLLPAQNTWLKRYFAQTSAV